MFTADWTLVWWNTTWSALHGDPAVIPTAERNLARALFGNGPARASMRPVRSERGPDAFEASVVADLKDAVSRYPADARLDRLVRELRGTSDAFAHHWATRTSAIPHTTDRKTIRHPEVGDILLDCDVLIVPGADLRMVTSRRRPEAATRANWTFFASQVAVAPPPCSPEQLWATASAAPGMIARRPSESALGSDSSPRSTPGPDHGHARRSTVAPLPAASACWKTSQLRARSCQGSPTGV